MNAEHLAALYRSKARAELDAADALVAGSAAVRWRGDPLADVVIVAGSPSEEDRAAGAAVTGATGDAAAKALDALGVAREAVLTLVSRPVEGTTLAALTRRLELAVEAVDPRLVIAIDAAAAEDLAAAYSTGVLEQGRAVRARGRMLGYVGDLGASLDDVELKTAVWKAFKSVAARSPL